MVVGKTEKNRKRILLANALTPEFLSVPQN